MVPGRRKWRPCCLRPLQDDLASRARPNRHRHAGQGCCRRAHWRVPERRPARASYADSRGALRRHEPRGAAAQEDPRGREGSRVRPALRLLPLPPSRCDPRLPGRGVSYRIGALRRERQRSRPPGGHTRSAGCRGGEVMPEGSPASRLDGSLQLLAATETLAGHLPPALKPLARVAYNYAWSWTREWPRLFRSIDPERWQRAGENPIRLAQEVSPRRMEELARDADFVSRIDRLAGDLERYLAEPMRPSQVPADRPVAFMCAEFGVHATLPTYAGGLGVLAGDLLKEASDQRLPLLGLGILYSQGSFHQRLDENGLQHEFWLETDAERLPAVLVRDLAGSRLTVEVPLRNRKVLAQVWRVDVGRVPLFLLDTNLAANSPADRLIGARLYVGDRETRLAQYALLGMGGVRALRAMGLAPSFIHLNEGHAAFAQLETVAGLVASGCSFEEAAGRARAVGVFTTHTPVAAGNDAFSADQMRATLDEVHLRLGLDWEQFLRLGRCHPDDPYEPFGMTPFALRMTGRANGVSRRHGEVSRRVWHDIWPGVAVEDVPIEHVTNGVHVPTWMASSVRNLLDEYMGRGWENNVSESHAWRCVQDIPDEVIWGLRNRLRTEFVAYVRERSVHDRLGRGQPIAYAEAAARVWDERVLTVGFARRIATYKRLYLISALPERALNLIRDPRPIQLAIAGKAHPQDEEAKRTVQQLFTMDAMPGVSGRVVFLEEHDMAMAARLVQGCDLWVNLPRPPLEASGTSGMKSALNGGLQLSVLDGWWAEAYDGTNGWAIPAREGLDAATEDARDASALLDILEQEVLPLFYDRGQDGIPHGWVQRIKSSMISIGPRFNTARMLNEYLARAPARPDPAERQQADAESTIRE
ncbi:MAG: alpha-glucan phosphorylase [Anaerolinea sp.]|nr:alpha-glucan phosphorylase [Anaerolinea sp.]